MTDDSLLLQFIQKISQHLQQHSLSRLVLSRYQGTDDLQKITIRPVEIKQQWLLSFVYSYKTRDITKNFVLSEALVEIQQQLTQHFRQANLFTQTMDAQLSISKKVRHFIRKPQ